MHPNDFVNTMGDVRRYKDEATPQQVSTELAMARRGKPMPLDVRKAHAHAQAACEPIDYSMHTSEVAEEAHRDRRDPSGPRLGMVLLMLSACIVIGVPLLAWLARR